eukprot:CAMPEP_0181229498 /NCGR_PEP_ID=MMETSP1096-20121128/33929_1 /TAXON_ID=156174 ORGANISM="Chrysochromulina ericina, Strain CCMP281" /NCGR_SAMPLE_ID=MMETSP1096 /ASSEMBLY_ACC=CAM_ASM_000453 /LENGTH=81 /DNA_ID=CAMNT_0023323125 /DNA_START=125 /DNA_END=371 /DNA_ORIENTATION=+
MHLTQLSRQYRSHDTFFSPDPLFCPSSDAQGGAGGYLAAHMCVGGRTVDAHGAPLNAAARLTLSSMKRDAQERKGSALRPW